MAIKTSKKTTKTVKPKKAAEKRAKKPVSKGPAAKEAMVKKMATIRQAPKTPAAKPEGEKPAKTRKSKEKAEIKPIKAVVKPPAAKPSKKAAVSSKISKTKVSKKASETKTAAAAKTAKEVQPPLTPAVKKQKILPREFLIEIANIIRTAVRPLTRDPRGREIVGNATSGDATFEIDRVAEKALLTFLKNARLPVAYYSEGSGYTTFTNTQPQHLLIIDPVDGSRAAKSGFEGCAVSIATTRVIERPVMADLDNACVAEIMGDRVFYAERGKGVRIMQDGHLRRFKAGADPGLEELSWSMTVPGRPADLIFPTAAKLIDLTSLKGGFFACNSTSYSLTRLLTNQLDACVDIANRFYRDIPDLVRDHFINAGRGAVIGIEPYDMAAALLIAQEAGCIVTDAYGKSFDNLLLLDTSIENMRSMIAAANESVHEKLLTFFDMRVRQWEELLRRRAEHAEKLAKQKQVQAR